MTKENEAITKFASNAHEEWRKGFEDSNGKGTERIKDNSDGTKGNINVPFNQLHPDWQKENLQAGAAALEAVKKYPNDIEKASEHIHNKWMERNPKQDWNASQHVPYSELPEEEKEKDRVHVRTMNNILGNSIKEMVESILSNNLTESTENFNNILASKIAIKLEEHKKEIYSFKIDENSLSDVMDTCRQYFGPESLLKVCPLTKAEKDRASKHVAKEHNIPLHHATKFVNDYIKGNF